jgi:hypothetical protein
MLYVRALLLIVAAVLSSCGRVSRDEAIVIGTWRQESADAAIRYSFTPDHLVAVCFPEAREQCDPSTVLRGRWWIRGQDVVYKLDSTPLKALGVEPRPDEEQTIPLARFRDRSTPQVAPYFRRVDERI